MKKEEDLYDNHHLLREGDSRYMSLCNLRSSESAVARALPTNAETKREDSSNSVKDVAFGRQLSSLLLGFLATLFAFLWLLVGLTLLLNTVDLFNHESAGDSTGTLECSANAAYLSLTSPAVSFPPYARLTDLLLDLTRLKAPGLHLETPCIPVPFVVFLMY